MEETLPARLRATARVFAAHPAVRFADRSVSFAEVDRYSDRVAAWLAGQGIAKGDPVALYCPNSDQFAIAYTGIVKAGAVVVPVNLLYSPDEVAYVLHDAGARVMLYHQSFADKVDALRAVMERVEVWVRIGQGAGLGSDPNWAELLACTEPPRNPAIDPAEDLAAILYTSGTTGRPKGAMLSHRNLLANTTSVLQALKLRPGEDTLLVVLPMFHSFAATVGMLTPLLHGLSFAPLSRFEPEAVSRTIEAVGATVFLGVPSMYSVLLRLSDQQVARWASVRYGVSGGAAMPVEVMRRFEDRFGIPIQEGDGPTECSPVTCVNPIDGRRKPGSVGLEVPDVEIRILDDAGGELPTGEIGELCVRGANVMKGYWNLPEATNESFFGEWFRTGDLGHKDDQGYVYIVDRKKDMLIVNGMNVYPRMVEEALYRHPAIREAAVVGEPHDLHGEIPIAYVALKEDSSVEAADIRAWCREQLGRHEWPRKVLVLPDLPKNATGKILKRELRRDGELERGVDSRPAGQSG